MLFYIVVVGDTPIAQPLPVTLERLRVFKRDFEHRDRVFILNAFGIVWGVSPTPNRDF